MFVLITERVETLFTFSIYQMQDQLQIGDCDSNREGQTLGSDQEGQALRRGLSGVVADSREVD